MNPQSGQRLDIARTPFSITVRPLGRTDSSFYYSRDDSIPQGALGKILNFTGKSRSCLDICGIGWYLKKVKNGGKNHLFNKEEITMKFPAELKYTRDHEWIQDNGDGTALIGITDFAQSELGDIVYVNLPTEGDEVTADESFCDVESVKAVSDVMSPCTAIIDEVNGELDDDPQLLNEDPYSAWIIKVKDISGYADLMSADEYEALVSK